MRILLANSTAYPRIGGVENSLRFIGRELLRAGHEVKIFCLQFSPDEPLHIEHEDIEIIRYPCRNARWPHMQQISRVAAVQRAMPTVLDEFQPDAVWSRSTPVGWGIVRSGYNVPLVHILPVTAKLDADSRFLRTKGMSWRRRLLLLGLWPSHYFIASWIERRLLQHSKPVVFSENMRRAVLRSYGEKVYRRTMVIHPGVDTSVFSPARGEAFFPEIEDKYGISAANRIVLFVGRFSAMKNLYGLIDAFAKLKAPCQLVLVGDGSERDRLSSLVSERGLVNRVVFTGKQSELLPGFYAMARVFVNPSLIEPFGQTLLEAQACETPVVGFGGDHSRILTATDEIIQDGETGGVVSDDSARALAKKIDSILFLDDQDYAAMARRSRENVRERFSWSRFVAEALAISSQ